ncbi:hydrogenase maturation nickel metallochaperone HypA [Legionella israelensis]|uniref:Hydrogenase maturation factor HypA n=1 Tax=Legionella israelensis TaxID=454 RepID=A0A0W0V1W9_9GAMM|nr:hydrogenase maturation nickel metallochaperone HypA [Legionella israelensis]KTD14115.1 hydrogenase nickel incorporation protein HypA [Legionella israelensis]QBS10320.1 hydrogenase maturation nickel metallochaperone HypA [Legionella israelensis]SCY34657.1 Hydrogenase-3 nickel incorporation protein HypA [Legionella israelensis DSM 19235]STX59921.1 hydrogenase nickel incorporation protein HypA [Legionella israelensis]
MHEMTLCKNILEIVKQHVKETKGAWVKKICLEIGQLTCVERSALQFSFDVAAKGTVAEQAILDIIDIEGKARCETCQKIIKIKQYYDPCQSCGNFSLSILQGEELKVKYMEME